MLHLKVFHLLTSRPHKQPQQSPQRLICVRTVFFCCSWCKADCPASSHIMQCFSLTALTPCTNYIGLGLGLALLAALCNGSFSALAKCDRVRQAQVRAFDNCTGMNSGQLQVTAADLHATCGCPDSLHYAYRLHDLRYVRQLWQSYADLFLCCCAGAVVCVRLLAVPGCVLGQCTHSIWHCAAGKTR
jgi:hypothetical protein